MYTQLWYGYIILNCMLMTIFVLGLNLLDAIHDLAESDDPELSNQCDTLLDLIHEVQRKDGDAPHVEVFNNIFKQVQIYRYSLCLFSLAKTFLSKTCCKLFYAMLRFF